MMSSYVCRQCRIRLTQHATQLQPPQWHRKASFISLLRRDPPKEPTETTTQQSKEHETGQKELNIQEDVENLPSPAFSRQFEGPQSRYSKLLPEDKHVQTTPSESLPAKGPKHIQLDFSTHHAVRISNSLDKKRWVAAWTGVLKSYPNKDCHALTQPAFEDATLLSGGKLFARLLSHLTFHWGRGGNLAAPTTILSHLHSLGVLQPSHWNKVFLLLTSELLRRASTKVESNTVQAETILGELLSVWRLFCQCNGTSDSPVETLAESWDFLPGIEEMSSTFRAYPDLASRLQTFHPKCAGNNVTALSAATIFLVFDKRSLYHLPVSESLRADNEPFLNVITHCLASASMASLRRWVNEPHRQSILHPSLNTQLETASTDALAIVGPRRDEASSVAAVEPERKAGSKENAGSDGNTESMGRVESKEPLDAFMLKRIARAVHDRSGSKDLERLWRESIRNYTKEQKTIIPPEIYNAFLNGYLVASQADRSVEVWNHMLAHGVRPDVRSYHAMLSGCAKMKDVDGVNQIWDKMIRAGVKPDTYCWTARVDGLMSSFRHINAGFVALDEMGRTWLAAEKAIKASSKARKSKSALVNPEVKPSIEVINAAVSAMVGITSGAFPFAKKSEAIHKVLKWGGNFTIRPDAVTYNTLLNFYLLGNQHNTALKLLAQMETEGVEPDIATYSLLIRAAFENIGNQSHEQQSDTIMSYFAQLEAGGVKLNAYVYSTAVDRLLKLYGNVLAVRRIMEHMTDRGISASTQIYTSLTTHYFASEPPNIEAVDSLMHQVFSTKGAPTDGILFDRVIEGYAQHNEIGRMMAFMTRMSTLGRVPGWQALIEVVRALAKDGDVERVRRVVDDVRIAEGEEKTRPQGGQGRRAEFWRLVGRMEREEGGVGDGVAAGGLGGLLDGGGVKRVDDDEDRWILKGNEGTEVGDEHVGKEQGEVESQGDRVEDEDGKEALEAALGWSGDK